MLLALLLPTLASAQSLFSPPPLGALAVSYHSRAEANEALVSYGLHDRFALGLHGLRNHWPQRTELHYAIARLDTKLAGEKTESSEWRLHAITGLGLANKLKGIDRLASQLGLEAEMDTPTAHASLRAYSLGAKDFDSKQFVRARAGFRPYRAEGNEPSALFFMQAQYENLAQHRIEWGPALRLDFRNVGLELYGNFKGNWSFAFGFVY